VSVPEPQPTARGVLWRGPHDGREFDAPTGPNRHIVYTPAPMPRPRLLEPELWPDVPAPLIAEYRLYRVEGSDVLYDGRVVYRYVGTHE